MVEKKITLTLSDAARFWSRVSAGKPEECWVWKGTRQTSGMGYGAFWLKDGRQVCSAHRIAFTSANGEIPLGKVIRHSCNNPICVNPKHLFCGTTQDNVTDRSISGRNDPPKGQKVVTTSLKDEEVRQIYFRYWGLGIDRATLLDEYGVTKSVLYRIIHRRDWRSVTEPLAALSIRGHAKKTTSPHPRSRLTPEQVEQIFVRATRRHEPHRSLAKEFGVVTDTISGIVSGRSWTQVTEPLRS